MSSLSQCSAWAVTRSPTSSATPHSTWLPLYAHLLFYTFTPDFGSPFACQSLSVSGAGGAGVGCAWCVLC